MLNEVLVYWTELFKRANTVATYCICVQSHPWCMIPSVNCWVG